MNVSRLQFIPWSAQTPLSLPTKNNRSINKNTFTNYQVQILKLRHRSRVHRAGITALVTLKLGPIIPLLFHVAFWWETRDIKCRGTTWENVEGYEVTIFTLYYMELSLTKVAKVSMAKVCLPFKSNTDVVRSSSVWAILRDHPPYRCSIDVYGQVNWLSQTSNTGISQWPKIGLEEWGWRSVYFLNYSFRKFIYL